MNGVGNFMDFLKMYFLIFNMTMIEKIYRIVDEGETDFKLLNSPELETSK